MAEERRDDIKVGVPCPNCGRKTKTTLAWLRANDEFACSCGHRSPIDQQVVRSIFQQVGDVPTDIIREALGQPRDDQ